MIGLLSKASSHHYDTGPCIVMRHLGQHCPKPSILTGCKDATMATQEHFELQTRQLCCATTTHMC